MNGSAVTLEEVLVAAGARLASLVPETSGYLALAVGDATARLPLRIDDAQATLSLEGTVAIGRTRDVVPPHEAAGALRGLLAKLLARSAGMMPGLSAAARARDESGLGVEDVVQEIEAALIPVNRAAARRALARLARETARARDAGLLPRAREEAAEPPRPKEEPPAPAPAKAAAPAPAPAKAAAPVVRVTLWHAEPSPREGLIEAIVTGATPAPAGAAHAPVSSPRTPTPLPVEARPPTPPAPQVVEQEPAPAGPCETGGEGELGDSDTIATPAWAEPALWLDEAPTTLDVVTAMRDAAPSEPSPAPRLTLPFGVMPGDDERAQGAPPVAPAAVAEQPPPSEPPSERLTRPFGIEVAPPPREAERGPAPQPSGDPPPEPRFHVETLPMRFEPGRVELGAASRAAPAAAPMPPPAAAAAPAPAPSRAREAVAPAAADQGAPRPLVLRDAGAEIAAVEAPRVPPAVAVARPRGVADLAASPKSSVDDLLASFGRTQADESAFRAVAAGLKAIADLDPTALPPAVALSTNDGPGPTEPRSLGPLPRRPVPLASRLPEPRKPSRSGLAFSIALLVVGLVATGLLWQYHPSVFTGRGSPFFSPGATPEPAAAPARER